MAYIISIYYMKLCVKIRNLKKKVFYKNLFLKRYWEISKICFRKYQTYNSQGYFFLKTSKLIDDINDYTPSDAIILCYLLNSLSKLLREILKVFEKKFYLIVFLNFIIPKHWFSSRKYDIFPWNVCKNVWKNLRKKIFEILHCYRGIKYKFNIIYIKI